LRGQGLGHTRGHNHRGAVTTKEIPKRELREGTLNRHPLFGRTCYNKRNPKKGIESGRGPAGGRRGRGPDPDRLQQKKSQKGN